MKRGGTSSIVLEKSKHLKTIRKKKHVQKVPSSYLRDQIRVADNGSHKETVVRNLCAHLHAGCTQVQVHLVVGARDGS